MVAVRIEVNDDEPKVMDVRDLTPEEAHRPVEDVGVEC